MTDRDNTNRGVLFKNQRKQSDRHPDYTGSINVDGVEHFLDAWIKRSGKGETFMSLSVKRKDKQSESGSSQGSRVSPRQVDPDDGIPFAPEWR